MKRFIINTIVGMYLGAGIFGGSVMKAAIPELNVVGVVVYAVSWPNFLYCADISNKCVALDFIPLKYKAYIFNYD